jgi:hypothetical protein
MIHSAATQASSPVPPPLNLGSTPYQAGVCNIGPAEIARRRRSGQIGALITIALLAVLIALNVPAPARLLIALPAAGAASGYLQAFFKFCAGFASKGVFNFGALGGEEQVVDAADHARDRSRANQILLASLAIGLLVGLVAVVLPL